MGFIVKLHRVSEFFFLLLGSAFLIAFLFWHHKVQPFYAEIFLRLGDLPLAFFGILYALLSLRISFSYQYHGADRLHNDESNFLIGDILLFLLGAIIFSAILYADLFLPSVLLFPQSFA